MLWAVVAVGAVPVVVRVVFGQSEVPSTAVALILAGASVLGGVAQLLQTALVAKGDLQTQLVETSERSQIRASEGSVRHVEVSPVGSMRTPIIRRPRPLRRTDTRYTLNCEDPGNPWVTTRGSPCRRRA